MSRAPFGARFSVAGCRFSVFGCAGRPFSLGTRWSVALTERISAKSKPRAEALGYYLSATRGEPKTDVSAIALAEAENRQRRAKGAP